MILFFYIVTRFDQGGFNELAPPHHDTLRNWSRLITRSRLCHLPPCLIMEPWTFEVTGAAEWFIAVYKHDAGLVLYDFRYFAYFKDSNPDRRGRRTNNCSIMVSLVLLNNSHIFHW